MNAGDAWQGMSGVGKSARRQSGGRRANEKVQRLLLHGLGRDGHCGVAGRVLLLRACRNRVRRGRLVR